MCQYNGLNFTSGETKLSWIKQQWMLLIIFGGWSGCDLSCRCHLTSLKANNKKKTHTHKMIYLVPLCTHEMETNISTFTPPAHKKTLPPRQYIFITYLGSKWLHHLTFKSPLLHWRHSAEFINQYDTAEPRPPLHRLWETSMGITDNGRWVNEGWGGESRVPGEAARGIFTATNNDNSGNIALPMCWDNSNDWPRVIVLETSLLTSRLPWRCYLFIGVREFLIDVSRQSVETATLSLAADITYR